jgi:hypothetical protein
MSNEDIKKELEVLLGREPTCSLLKDGKYMADFFKYGENPAVFIGTTEEDALHKLYIHLKEKPAP